MINDADKFFESKNGRFTELEQSHYKRLLSADKLCKECYTESSDSSVMKCAGWRLAYDETVSGEVSVCMCDKLRLKQSQTKREKFLNGSGIPSQILTEIEPYPNVQDSEDGFEILIDGKRLPYCAKADFSVEHTKKIHQVCKGLINIGRRPFWLLPSQADFIYRKHSFSTWLKELTTRCDWLIVERFDDITGMQKLKSFLTDVIETRMASYYPVMVTLTHKEFDKSWLTPEQASLIEEVNKNWKEFSL